MEEEGVGHGWNDKGVKEVFPLEIFSDLASGAETDVLTLPPLGRVPLEAEVRQYIANAFPEDALKAHRDRLCLLLEQFGYYSTALIGKLYTSLVVGNPSLRTAAEANVEASVLHHLCMDSKLHAHWDRFKSFLCFGYNAASSAASVAPPFLLSLGQQLSNLITRKLQATSDPASAQAYRALHKAYFGIDPDSVTIARCWLTQAEQEQVRLWCAFPGCNHPHAYTVKCPSKVTFDRLFDHVHDAHIPKDAVNGQERESRKRAAPSSSAGTASISADPSQHTLPTFLAKRKALTAPPTAAATASSSAPPGARAPSCL